MTDETATGLHDGGYAHSGKGTLDARRITTTLVAHASRRAVLSPAGSRSSTPHGDAFARAEIRDADDIGVPSLRECLTNLRCLLPAMFQP